MIILPKRKNEKSLEEVIDDFVILAKKIRAIPRKMELKKQRKMKFPTDPQVIHERAEEIRAIQERERAEARRLDREKKTLEEDMKTIRYYQRMNDMKKKTLAQRIMNKLRGGVK